MFPRRKCIDIEKKLEKFKQPTSLFRMIMGMKGILHLNSLNPYRKIARFTMPSSMPFDEGYELCNLCFPQKDSVKTSNNLEIP